MPSGIKSWLRDKLKLKELHRTCPFPHKMKNWMAAKEKIPKIPRIVETRTVNKLIGMCSPIELPNTFAKKSNKTPIATRMIPWDNHWAGLAGKFMRKNNNTTATIERKIIVGIKFNPFMKHCYSIYMPDELIYTWCKKVFSTLFIFIFLWLRNIKKTSDFC